MNRRVISICLSLLLLAGAPTLPVAAHVEAPTPSPIPPSSATPVSMPHPPASPFVPSEPAGDPGPVNDVQPDWTVTPPQPSLTPEALERVVVARACLDVNANDWCDVDEGIAGLHVFILDGTNGMIRATAITDRTGTAQRTVLVRPDQLLTINIPYLGTYHTVRGDRQPDPVLVTQVPPLPGLLP